MLKTSIATNDDSLARLCREYWELKPARPGRVTPPGFAHTVADLARTHGLSRSEVTARVAEVCEAWVPSETCPGCGEPHRFRSRTEYLEHYKRARPARCGRCAATAASVPRAAPPPTLHRRIQVRGIEAPRHFLDEDSGYLLEEIAEAEILLADSAARAWFRAPPAAWDVTRDMPALLPPPHPVWLESAAPQPWTGPSRWGVLLLPEDLEATRALSGSLSKGDREARDRARRARARWVTYAYLFVDGGAGRPAGPLLYLSYPSLATGAFSPTDRSWFEYSHTSPAQADHQLHQGLLFSLLVGFALLQAGEARLVPAPDGNFSHLEVPGGQP